MIAQDSYDHASNSQGQWIREATNVFTDGGFEDFREGECAGTRADSATGTVALTRIEGTRCSVEGTYTLMLFDAGRTTTLGTATWTADVPAGTSLRFLVAVSSTAGGPWVFVGPDGTAGSYFTSSGTAFTAPPAGRYVCYRATFASGAARLASPTLSGFNLGLGGATSRVVSYTYGPHGNVVSRRTVDSATGTTADARDSLTWPASDRIHTQNQLLRRDVTSSEGTTVTWRYTYDSAGNMTSKTDGTQTTPTPGKATTAWCRSPSRMVPPRPTPTMRTARCSPAWNNQCATMTEDSFQFTGLPHVDPFWRGAWPYELGSFLDRFWRRSGVLARFANKKYIPIQIRVDYACYA